MDTLEKALERCKETLCFELKWLRSSNEWMASGCNRDGKCFAGFHYDPLEAVHEYEKKL